MQISQSTSINMKKQKNQIQQINLKIKTLNYKSKADLNIYKRQKSKESRTLSIRRMQLFKAVSAAIRSNTQLPITQTISDITFGIQKYTTYGELVKLYDPSLLECLKQKDCFDQRIVIIEVEMHPENMHWIIWKNYQQISQFLQQIASEIQLMSQVPEFQLNKDNVNTSNEVIMLHRMVKSQLDMGVTNFNQQTVMKFVQFMNTLGQQMYLRKTISFLVFIGHCVSIDKWHLMIHYQTFVYKDPQAISNKFKGFFSSQQTSKSIQCFVTISGDGILFSYDHLLLNKVQKMIPFTNQMKIKCQLLSDDSLVYEITSGKNMGIKLNFYKDYFRGINFGCGLGRALKYSGYNFLMGIDVNTQMMQEKKKSFGFQSTVMRVTPNLTSNRYESYSQVRENSNCKLYADGCGYYEDLHNELLKAQRQVCITGWMITPYFLLKRPGNINDPQHRLDGVLGKLSERGVKIFIIVFMQPSLLVNNDSQHVQKHLESLHKNIKVYRHPNVAVPQLWSHHQKMVVIDQKIGFMGGLDICYGRWDTHDHRLVQEGQRKFWDGQEFNNYRLKDIYQPRVFWKSNLNKAFQPRMPWHDIAAQIRGDVVIDLLRHFVQYWYFVKSQLSTDPRVYFNTLKSRLVQANQYYEKIQKQYLLAQLKNDTQETFSQKFNSFKEKLQVFTMGGEKRVSELLIEQRPGMNEGNMRIQMLRSASQWSIGLDPAKFESSIHNAYIDLIKNAQKFIYIENQFFMGLQNKIVETLANRIIRARAERKTFRVVIVMPLLPGFEGYIGDPGATVLRIQMHWQYQAISRGKQSLFERLRREGFSHEQISNYIYFFGLRKGDILNKLPVTEIIYVHSKLMIVDDKKTICGSANINDRSLLGNRDSEIAICVEDDKGEQTATFRKNVFMEHFGFSQGQSCDYTNDKVWNQLISRAVNNTKIFRQTFACIPDDLVSNILQIDTFQQKFGDITKWFSLSQHLRGHAVTFPLQFMSKEDLTFKLTQVEYFAPDHTFT